VSGASLPLEDEVARFLAADERGTIAVLGGPGAGKKTALQHLAAVFPPDGRLTLLDTPDAETVESITPCRLVVYTAFAELAVPHLAIYRLASWNDDDLIEYLLAVHKPRCASVMARVQDDRFLLGGVPELWRVALDHLADDESLPDARRALHRHLETRLSDTDLLERARSACLNALLTADTDLTRSLAQLAKPGFVQELIRVLRHAVVQQLLAAERIAADLHGDSACDCLAVVLPREVVHATAKLIAKDLQAIDHLHALLKGESWSHAMSASLLHAAGTGWVPSGDPAPVLAEAFLDGIRAPGVKLAGANLLRTDFSEADLKGADLRGALVHKTCFRAARLQAANLEKLVALEADFSYANLSEAQASGALFNGADLIGASCDKAMLNEASFWAADLTRASFRNADLSHAYFVANPPTKGWSSVLLGWMAYRSKLNLDDKRRDIQLEGADFTEATLDRAVLSGLCLRPAIWTGASFSGAQLDGCDLEYLSLPGADFSYASLKGALLTGTSMPGAKLNMADLRETGLADVDWEGVDLRDANLRGATFHMGSSRSGLVGSPIACEGSRTGFYTDEYEEQTYKAPEEIRKANLCGAYLRGACLEDVDFYLVDLRGALYTPEQETHLRRCGAILGTRV
jgi:uncharacterized protein YjbI with pentapeptide repeats